MGVEVSSFNMSGSSSHQIIPDLAIVDISYFLNLVMQLDSQDHKNIRLIRLQAIKQHLVI